MLYDMRYKKYEQNKVSTSSPEDLTLMLYNGMIKFIMLAQVAIEEKNTEKAYNNILKAKKIVIYLEYTLDMKYEVSKSMMDMYEYIHKRLTDANIKKDNEILKEVLGFAKEMRDTWSQAMKIAKGQNNVSVNKQISNL